MVLDPEDLTKFVGYVKQEIAHQVNAVLGKRKRTIWCDGYDSPILITYNDIIEYFAYIFTNPQSAHLVERIEEYPGCSSWGHLISNTLQITRERNWRNPEDKEPEEVTLTIEPFAWLQALEGEFYTEETAIRDLKEAIRQKELLLMKERRESRRGVMGARRLATQGIISNFAPKKFGRRMLIICRDLDFRKNYIKTYKYLCEFCRNVFSKWKAGDYSLAFPVGMFPPARPKTISPRLSIEFANAA